MKTRKIDKRFKPPVKGIDLWQAMNYISLADVSLDFIYNNYTSAIPCYTRGSRPALEKIANRILPRSRDSFAVILALAHYVAQEIRWAGYYEGEKGRRLPGDRNLTEERIVASRFGWCNEQARLLCALACIRKIPARLVFAGNRAGTYGHVVVEALTNKGWMLVDQSFGYGFARAGRPVNAWEVYHNPRMRRYFAPIYVAMCRQLEKTLGRDILSHAFEMALAKNPLDGFEVLGYCNHFV